LKKVDKFYIVNLKLKKSHSFQRDYFDHGETEFLFFHILRETSFKMFDHKLGVIAVFKLWKIMGRK